MESDKDRMGIHRKIRLLLACLLVVAVDITYAEQVEGLYNTEVVVKSQSKGELRKAASKGLATIFVRISGDPSVLNNAAIVQARSNAQSYLNQFSYQTELEEDNEVLSVVLEYEAALVSKTLRQAGMPIWSSDRPGVLVWLIVDTQQSRQLVTSEETPELAESLNNHSRRRGLALKLPKDKTAINVGQAWSLNGTVISQASQPYQADNILVGKLSRLSNGRWLGQWQYWLNDRIINFDSEAAGADQFIADGLDRVADIQASAYAIVPVKTSGEGIVIELTGINDFTDYARVIAHLESLAAVEHANVMHLQGSTLIVRLLAEGQLQQLQKAIALGKQLKSQTVPVDSAYPIVLSYQWLERE
jgi:hypothetical protein